LIINKLHAWRHYIGESCSIKLLDVVLSSISDHKLGTGDDHLDLLDIAAQRIMDLLSMYSCHIIKRSSVPLWTPFLENARLHASWKNPLCKFRKRIDALYPLWKAYFFVHIQNSMFFHRQSKVVIPGLSIALYLLLMCIYC
jgi:hypothetical protein